MTRLIVVFVFGALFALVSVSRADPSPTPGVKFRRPNSHSVQVSSHNTTVTPTPGTHHTHIGGPGIVASAPGNSMRAGNADTIPKPASSRVVPTAGPGLGSGRVYLPNEYNEPDSPAAGPAFKSTGAPPASFKTKSQSNVVNSTATHKVAPRILIPPLKNSNATAGEEANTEVNIDADPPAPNDLGAPIVIPMIPRYDAVPRSKALYLPDGNVPVPVDYAPPAPDAPVQVSPTSLRAWNGEMTRETRTFDQTRVQVTTGADGARRWQFFWRTTGAKPRAARWEVATVPFVDDANNFPPAGLVAYGDASVNAQAPTTENFFAVEFNSLAKNFGNTLPPERLYLRVVPVDGGGNAAASPSNWVRVDMQ